MPLPPIATTTVGSFPRPSWLADVERSDAVFRLEGPALREAQDDATMVVLHEQEAVGLDLLTDGEQRRPNFINHFLAGLEGVDLANRAWSARCAARDRCWSRTRASPRRTRRGRSSWPCTAR